MIVDFARNNNKSESTYIHTSAISYDTSKYILQQYFVLKVITSDLFHSKAHECVPHNEEFMSHAIVNIKPKAILLYLCACSERFFSTRRVVPFSSPGWFLSAAGCWGDVKLYFLLHSYAGGDIKLCCVLRTTAVSLPLLLYKLECDRANIIFSQMLMFTFSWRTIRVCRAVLCCGTSEARPLLM